MALAHVVYQISTDKDFAERMQSDPEGTLGERGWSLSKEEVSFILSTLRRSAGQTEIRQLIKPLGLGWR